MELNGIIESTAITVAVGSMETNFFLPDLVEALVKRYRFVGRPTTPEDFQKEIKLVHGYFEGFIIGSLSLYNDGVVSTAVTDTTRMSRFNDEVFELLRADFGVRAESASINRFYNSRLEVTLSESLSRTLNVLHPIASKVQGLLQAYGASVENYFPASFSMAGVGNGKIQPGRFTLEPRAERAITENVFYSEAPLRTEHHLEILDDIEKLTITV